MLKKISKNLIIVTSLFLTFFCFQNVNAMTTYFQDDFDNYDVSDSLSEYSNWYSIDGFSSPVVSSDDDKYISSWNSLKFYYHDYAHSAIKHNFSSSLNSFYVSADILLENPSNFQQGPSIIQFEVTDGYNRNYVYFGCSKNFSGSLIGTIYYGSGDYSENNELVNQLCNGAFNNVSVYFERDLLNERTIISSYINGDLVSTIYDVFYTGDFSDISIFSTSAIDGVYLDNFIISDALPSSSVDGLCGSANGSTFDWADYNDQDFCSSGDFYLSGDNGERIIYACEGLNGGTTQYNCYADYYHNLEPTITDVIDFDFDNFTYDFEEGDVSKNWLIDVFKFLFLPREETLQKFFTTFDNFKQKIPFGYIYLIQNQVKQVSLESTEEFALNLDLLGEDYEVFSITSLKQDIGENTFNVLYDTMRALIWLMFVLYLITKSQKLFNNND